MNRPSLEKFEPELVSGGLMVYNSSLIDVTPTRDDVEIMALPATEIADDLGSAKAANVVALGAYLGITHLMDETVVLAALDRISKDRALSELNVKALRAGMEFVQARSGDFSRSKPTTEVVTTNKGPVCGSDLSYFDW